MHHLHTGKEPCFYEPLLLPAALQYLQQALAQATGNEAAQQAARLIVKEYCSFFDPGCIRHDMQQLLHASFCHPNIAAMADIAERQNLFLFYEFTLVLVDALFVLQAEKTG